MTSLRPSSACLWLFLTVASNVAAHEAAVAPVPRLAIISDQGTRTAADMLTARLSRTNVELLERDLIDAILEEHALVAAAGERTQAMRIGQLLNADGLFFLRSARHSVGGDFEARLVAAAPGVIVWLEQYSLGDSTRDIRSWAENTAGILQPLLPKLNISREDAIPLSFLDLRPSVNTMQWRQTGDNINRLLFLRLIHEPSLFVLERDNLARLEEEKLWTGGGEDFWAGGKLLDGTIEIDLLDNRQFSLEVRLRPGVDAPALELSTASSIDELAVAVETISERIISHLQLSPSTGAWNPVAEGREYYNLSRWVPGHKARLDAINTAWALGYREPAAATRRLSLMLSDTGFPHECDSTGGVSSLLRPSNKLQAWLNENPEMHHEYLRRNLVLTDFFLNYRPPAGFEWRSQSREERWRREWNDRWNPVVIRAVRALWWINHSGLREKYADEFYELQSNARGIVMNATDDGNKMTRRAADNIIDYARYIFRSPEELKIFYRGMLDLPRDLWLPNVYCIRAYADIRYKLLGNNVLVPLFTDISEDEREKNYSDWLEEFRNSDEPERRLAVIEREIAKTEDIAERYRLYWKMLDIMWEHRDLLATARIDPHRYLRRPLAAVRSRIQMGVPSTRDHQEFAKSFWLYVLEHGQTRQGPFAHDIGSILFARPYLALYTKDDAIEVDAAFRRHRESGSGSWSYLHRWLLDRFPDLDVERVLPFKVSRKLTVSPEIGVLRGESNGVLHNTYQFEGNRLWFVVRRFEEPEGFDHNAELDTLWLYSMDLVSGDVSIMPGPEQWSSRLGGRAYFNLSNKHIILLFATRTPDPAGGLPEDHGPTVFFIYDRHAGTGWQRYETSVTIQSTPVIIGNDVFSLYISPGLAGRDTFNRGILRINLPDGASSILTNRQGPRGATPLNHPSISLSGHLEIAGGSDDRLYVRHRRNYLSYMPADNQWESISREDWLALPKTDYAIIRPGGTVPPRDFVFNCESRRELIRLSGLCSYVFDKKERRPIIPLEYSNDQSAELKAWTHGRYAPLSNKMILTPFEILIPCRYLIGFWRIEYDELRDYLVMRGLYAENQPE